MKWLKAALIGAMVFLGAAKAQAATEIDEVINSSCTYTVVSVSSSVATQLDATVLENRKVIEVQAQQGGNFRIDFSSTAGLTTTYGRVLTSSSTVSYALRARDNDGNRLTLWALNDSGAGARNVGVTQCRSK